jgi:hypothetical protein
MEVTMSILDKFRGSANKAKEQAEHAVEQHGDKIATGIEKTGEAVSKVTGHRFDDKIDRGVSKAKERLEGDGGDASASPAEPDPPTAPPPADDAGSEPGKGTSA